VIAEQETQTQLSEERLFEGPSLPLRAFRGLATFARRKPLGAFGAVILIVPVLAAIILPGFDIGPLHFPSLLKYRYNEYVLGQDQYQGPSWKHLMGTDQIGRDLFSRLLYGSRLSYFIGWSVFAISSVMSVSLTLVSAYYIRSVDLILQRIIEIIGHLPQLILIVALFSIYGAKPLTLILTLAVLRGFNTSRILRSVVIQVRTLPFIESARAIGATDGRIILRHVLPQVGYLIIVNATGGLAAAVLAESGLAILGVGLDPSYPTFGNLLNGSRQYLRVAPWLALFPGFTIFLLLLGARLLGDALRDVLDPRLRGSR
jgi:peptide/nickel transport system permease protein